MSQPSNCHIHKSIIQQPASTVNTTVEEDTPSFELRKKENGQEQGMDKLGWDEGRRMVQKERERDLYMHVKVFQKFFIQLPA